MKRNFSTSVAAMALHAGRDSLPSTFGASHTAPPIGGGYTNAVPIPVDDPATKNIAGGCCFEAGRRGSISRGRLHERMRRTSTTLRRWCWKGPRLTIS